MHMNQDALEKARQQVNDLKQEQAVLEDALEKCREDCDHVHESGDCNHVWGVNAKDEIYYRAP